LNAHLISQNINNKNVLADFPYYYLLTEKENRFISFYKNKQGLSGNILDRYNIEYAIITKGNYIKDFSLFQKMGFEEILDFNSKSEKGFFNQILSFRKNARITYDGVILKRNRINYE
jgi:hypothetical protein